MPRTLRPVTGLGRRGTRQDVTIVVDEIDSPIGPLVLAIAGETERRVLALAFGERWPEMRPRLASRTASEPATWRSARGTGDVGRRLRDYFAGDLAALAAIRVETGGTTFQRSVWLALRRIGPGRTASYADVARRIGHPRAVRAVGLANGANPVCLVVPCHRVIATGGGLGGYGGGLARKRWLLAHEGALRESATRRDR